MKAWKFLVQLIQLTLDIKGLFGVERVLLYCFEIPTSIFFILHIVAIILLEKVIVDARTWTCRLV